MNNIAEELKKIVPPSDVLTDEYMKAHTTFRIGGPADVFVTVRNNKEAADVVRLLLAQCVPFTVIGNGSNLLVSDSGYRGCIVCMGADEITVSGTTVTAKAGDGSETRKVANDDYADLQENINRQGNEATDSTKMKIFGHDIFNQRMLTFEPNVLRICD